MSGPGVLVGIRRHRSYELLGRSWLPIVITTALLFSGFGNLGAQVHPDGGGAPGPTPGVITMDSARFPQPMSTATGVPPASGEHLNLRPTSRSYPLGDEMGPLVYNTLVLANDTLAPGNYLPPTPGQPLAIALDSTLGEYFVADPQEGVVQFVSIATGSVQAVVVVGQYPDALTFVNSTGDLWVANGDSDSVCVITVANASITWTIPVGIYPDALVEDSAVGEVFVANQYSNNVTVIDESNHTVAATISGFALPAGLAYDPTQGEVFVANSGVKIVSIVSDSTNNIIANVSMPNDPTALTFDGIKDEVFAPRIGENTSGLGRNTTTYSNMTVISAATNRIVASIELGTASDAVAFDNQTGQVLVAKYVADQLAVVSDSTDQVVVNITTGYAPVGVSVDLQTRTTYVLNQGSNDVTGISLATDKVTGFDGLAPSPSGSAFDSATGSLYVTNTFSDNVLEVSTSTEKLLATIPVGFFPSAIVYDGGSDHLFITNALSNNVTVISGTSDVVMANVSVGVDPQSLTVDPADGLIFVANYESSNVSVLSDSTDRVVATIPVGLGPESIVYDPANDEVYVSEQLGYPTPGAQYGNVQVISPATKTVVGNVSGPVPYAGPIAYDGTTGDLYIASNTGDPFSSTQVALVSGATEAVRAILYVPGLVSALTYVNATQETLAVGSSFLRNPTGAVTPIADTTNLLGVVSVGGGPQGITWASGPGLVYVSNLASGTLSILTPGNLTPPPTYPVTFTESGLPTGYNWSVSVNGTTWLSNTSSVSFAEPNGTFSYGILSCFAPGCDEKYVSTTSPGTLTVSGLPVQETTTFVLPTYTITFAELGLAAGVIWTVTLNGTAESSTSNLIVFNATNGTYPYTVRSSNASYSPLFDRGNITVLGGDQIHVVTFAYLTYRVAFSETGLPPGTSWSFAGGGYNISTTSSSVWLTEPNGTYNFTVAPVPGFLSSYVGQVTVHGGPVTVTVTFDPTYPIDFYETGLAPGTNWSVTLGSTTLSTTDPTLPFARSNGSYPYTVTAIAGYTELPSHGVIDVTGSGVDEEINFTSVAPVTFPVTFTESGLASGTDWTVTIAGSSHSSTSTNLTFREANGTYDYSIGAIAGYHSDPVSGRFTLAGGPHSVSVAFSAVSTAPGGLGSLVNWLAIGAAIALVAVILIVLSLRRRARNPRTAPTAPGSAPPTTSPEAEAGTETRPAPNAEQWNQPK